MGLPPGKNTFTLCLANNTVQYASEMGLTPTRVLVKYGMIYRVVGKSAANCRVGSLAVADDLSTCMVAVPTLIYGEFVLGGPCVAVGEM